MRSTAYFKRTAGYLSLRTAGGASDNRRRLKARRINGLACLLTYLHHSGGFSAGLRAVLHSPSLSFLRLTGRVARGPTLSIAKMTSDNVGRQ